MSIVNMLLQTVPVLSSAESVCKQRSDCVLRRSCDTTIQDWECLNVKNRHVEVALHCIKSYNDIFPLFLFLFCLPSFSLSLALRRHDHPIIPPTKSISTKST